MKAEVKAEKNRKRQEPRQAKVIVNWNYTSEVTPGFRRLMSILLTEKGEMKDGINND